MKGTAAVCSFGITALTWSGLTFTRLCLTSPPTSELPRVQCDIAQHAKRWRVELDNGCDPVRLSRRLARKTLLAVAGLVSVHDDTWTTDRTTAEARWAEIEPSLANDLHTLLSWSRDNATQDGKSVEAALDGVVTQIIASFEASIGLWSSENGH